MKKKSKAEILIELMDNPSTRAMIKKTDVDGGRLKSGWKKCSI